MRGGLMRTTLLDAPFEMITLIVGPVPATGVATSPKSIPAGATAIEALAAPAGAATSTFDTASNSAPTAAERSAVTRRRRSTGGRRSPIRERIDLSTSEP
jgi:hypothetical protein